MAMATTVLLSQQDSDTKNWQITYLINKSFLKVSSEVWYPSGIGCSSGASLSHQLLHAASFLVT